MSSAIRNATNVEKLHPTRTGYMTTRLLYALIAGVVLLSLISPFVRKLMHGIH